MAKGARILFFSLLAAALLPNAVGFLAPLAAGVSGQRGEEAAASVELTLRAGAVLYALSLTPAAWGVWKMSAPAARGLNELALGATGLCVLTAWARVAFGDTNIGDLGAWLFQPLMLVAIALLVRRQAIADSSSFTARAATMALGAVLVRAGAAVILDPIHPTLAGIAAIGLALVQWSAVLTMLVSSQRSISASATSRPRSAPSQSSGIPDSP